ncbi:MAG: MBOAT family protein [Alloprevotella sp.]|nr:MBOAT family protein [Alloprevotella sp.]
MLFNSLEYLLFLPMVFMVYWWVAKSVRAKNVWLVAASYFFYGWWDWRFTLLLLTTTLSAYVGGILIERGSRRRLHLTANIVLNLGILCAFKYYDFFAESFCELAAALGLGAFSPLMLRVVLPVGISFYTFQAVSYTVDVYRRQIPAERDLPAFFAFLSFFPQLVAGPIERATNLLPQMRSERTFRYDKAVDGMRQILWGLFKKVVIADGCAEGANAIFAAPASFDGTTLLMGAVLFSFQIYGDFSGYSDIAVGSARLFGIELMQNFRTPYFARDIRDFWRRWHISLMTWLRDYVYIPLGGNRRGNRRKVLNTFIVFGLSGLWHGANWTFVLWGLYHGTLVSLSRHKAPSHLSPPGEASSSPLFAALNSSPGGGRWEGAFTFLLVTLGWILFRSASIGEAWLYLSHMVTHPVAALPAYGKTMVPLIFLMLLAEWLTRDEPHPLTAMARRISSPALRMCLYWLIGGCILWFSGNATQFIYFQF